MTARRPRIIPALAGNTRNGWRPRTPESDHPRSRGEYFGSRPLCRLPAGSSPLSRGILSCPPLLSLQLRIIPALAGNTRLRLLPLGPRRDHPRSRGEYAPLCWPSRTESGSSPLSRGILHPFHQGPYHDRIIPALAGNTGRPGLLFRGCPDHPRSRGEYDLEGGIAWQSPGSSPLSRGIRTPLLAVTDGIGIIPALAGNTHHPATC